MIKGVMGTPQGGGGTSPKYFCLYVDGILRLLIRKTKTLRR